MCSVCVCGDTPQCVKQSDLSSLFFFVVTHGHARGHVHGKGQKNVFLFWKEIEICRMPMRDRERKGRIVIEPCFQELSIRACAVSHSHNTTTLTSPLHTHDIQWNTSSMQIKTACSESTFQRMLGFYTKRWHQYLCV